MNDELIIIINILISLVNIGTIAINLKLYTEYFKDKSIDNRIKPDN